MALPPSTPFHQASRIAGAWSLIQGTVSGPAFISTTTVLGLAASTALTNSSCRPGRPRLVRSRPSASTALVVPT